MTFKYLCPDCSGYIEWKWANKGYRVCELCVNEMALNKAKDVLKQRPELAEIARQLLKGV